MSLASHGYDGTLDEADFARLMALVGRPPIVGGPTDLLVEPVAGSRAVTVRTGSAYATGVEVDLDDVDGETRLSLPTPTNGQFFLVTLRRDWQANNADPDAGDLVDGSSIEILTADTTDNTRPVKPPAVLPALAAEPGIRADQPVAWAWATSASTEVVVWDLRTWPADWERVPTIAARDAIPADRLWVGKRVHVDADGQTYRRAVTVWHREGVNPVDSEYRPVEPYLNMLIFETDTKQFGYWDGQDWIFPARDAGNLEGTVPVEALPNVPVAKLPTGSLVQRAYGGGDWNSITAPGTYKVGSLGSNAPSGAYAFGNLIVAGAENAVTQLYATHGSNTLYVRTKWNATDWTGWASLSKDGHTHDDRYYREDELNGGALDGRYYTEGEVNGFRGNDTFDIARITHSQYNSGSGTGGRDSFWKGYLPDTYSSKQDVENRISGRGLNQIAGGGVNIDPSGGSGDKWTGTYGVSLPGRMGTPNVVQLTPASGATANQQATVDSVGNNYIVIRYTRENRVTTYVHWLTINVTG